MSLSGSGAGFPADLHNFQLGTQDEEKESSGKASEGRPQVTGPRVRADTRTGRAGSPAVRRRMSAHQSHQSGDVFSRLSQPKGSTQPSPLFARRRSSSPIALTGVVKASPTHPDSSPIFRAMLSPDEGRKRMQRQSSLQHPRGRQQSPAGRRRQRTTNTEATREESTGDGLVEIEVLRVPSIELLGTSTRSALGTSTRSASAQPGQPSPQNEFYRGYAERVAKGGGKKGAGTFQLVGVVQQQNAEIRELAESRDDLSRQLASMREDLGKDQERCTEMTVATLTELIMPTAGDVSYLGRRPVPGDTTGVSAVGELKRLRELYPTGRSRAAAFTMQLAIAAVEANVRDALTWAADAGLFSLRLLARQTEPSVDVLLTKSFILDDSSQEERKLRHLLAKEQAKSEALQREIGDLDAAAAGSRAEELHRERAAKIEAQTQVSALETEVEECRLRARLAEEAAKAARAGESDAAETIRKLTVRLRRAEETAAQRAEADALERKGSSQKRSFTPQPRSPSTGSRRKGRSSQTTPHRAPAALVRSPPSGRQRSPEALRDILSSCTRSDQPPRLSARRGMSAPVTTRLPTGRRSPRVPAG
eukprot:TRINITY_DN2791_c0_g2_i2.p1 TRINITY_DN2791_c0_g2~~TRINITY_DN2791_c0_g2_i2.p1  ORF type:complete len:614 (+),score=125.60 TRINITY_DN2791_c0_g2_i2:67-1842(+)